MLEDNTVSFFFPEGYNLNNKLIIDPVLEFSTYSGSYADNFGYTATHDNFGFLYSGSTVLRQVIQQLLAHMIQLTTIQQAVQT